MALCACVHTRPMSQNHHMTSSSHMPCPNMVMWASFSHGSQVLVPSFDGIGVPFHIHAVSQQHCLAVRAWLFICMPHAVIVTW